MSSPVTPRTLFEKLREPLALEWVGGKSSGDKPIPPIGSAYIGMSLAGHLNFVRRPHVQVLGSREIEYLMALDPAARQEAITSIFDDAPFVFLADAQTPTAEIVREADNTDTPLFTARIDSHELVSHLNYHLATLLAERVTMHGVFLEVLGSGVLLTGDSGLGKSEVALELITRGHRLIADDAPEFARITPDIINGTCPEPLQDFLEVRGLGILNVRAMFGSNAVKSSRYLRLIINLEGMTEETTRGIDRLHGTSRTRKILGVDVPEITIFVAPGRNLAVLIEAAVRHQLLILRGYDAARAFIERQQTFIARDDP